MPTLKKIKKNTNKLLGASLPLWVYEYCTAFALAKGITKTDIIQPLLENWVRNEEKKNSIQTLHQEILERVKLEWITIKTKKVARQLFKSNIQKELSKKGFKKQFIDSILKQLQE